MTLKNKSEKGQALILIVFTIMGVLTLVGLGMDGGQAFSDRRQAQNACDAAALAAALTYQNSLNPSTVNPLDIVTNAKKKAEANGYPDALPRSTVEIDGNGTPVTGLCPGGKNGKEFTVTINSFIGTWFGGIIGVQQIHNQVTATARGCEYHYDPFFDGNTIVGLAPKPNSSFYSNGSAADIRTMCNGTASGGIFINGNATKSGNPNVVTPSMTVVGTSDFTASVGGVQQVKTGQTSEAYAYPADILDLMPRTPACNGTAYLSGGKWYPESGKDGSKVYDWNGNQTYAAGTYCVMSVGHPWKNALVANEGSTFFIMVPDLDMKLSGSGDALQIVAPSGSNEYAGYAIVMPLTCTGGVICDMAKLKANPPTQTVAPCVGNGTPTVDLRGNGNSGITGAIWMPTACLTLLGNSGTQNRGQIVAYYVQAGGNSSFDVCYDAPGSPKEYYPPSLELVK